MATEFKLPEVSEGVESADVAELHVAEGDVIEKDQVVMELETEKAVVELPCPHAGKVTKLHVSPGDSVSVGGTLLTIEASEEAEAGTETGPEPAEEAGSREPAKAEAEEEARREAPPVEHKKEIEKESAQAEKKEAPVAEERRKELHDRAMRPTGPEKAEVSPAAQAVSEPEERDGEQAPPPAGPATRRMARQLGVDLRRVDGSGPGGRITPEDVQAYVRDLTSTRAVDVSAPMAAPELPDFNRFGPVERRSLSKLAKTSANNLSLSWQTIPHVTQHDLADITDLETARKSYMQTIGKSGPKVTMTAIMIKAVVAALKAFPHFNSSLDLGAGELVLKRYYHIGVAVDTDYGLLVPVIRDADRKSVLELAGELSEVAEKARNRKLDMQDMQGATFTITNLGGIGGTAFTPIVNYPEVAILGMSRSRKEVELVDGRPRERLMLPLSLSYDHRVINGADAARFTVKLSQILSDFFQMVLEG